MSFAVNDRVTLAAGGAPLMFVTGVAGANVTCKWDTLADGRQTDTYDESLLVAVAVPDGGRHMRKPFAGEEFS